MIRELSDFGKKIRQQNKEGKLIHDALKDEPVSIELVIKQDGSFHDFIPFEKKMTVAEAITAKKGKARLLVDKAEEVLGYGGKSSNKKHQWFMEKLEQYKDLKELEPVMSFYGSNKAVGLDKGLAEFEKLIPNEKERKGNIAFRIHGKDKRIHEEPAVYQKIIENYENDQKQKLSASDRRCSICGKNAHAIVEIHEKIKTVPPVDDGKYGARALVSCNDDAYESYNLKRNQNAAICSNCAKNYVEGLNSLLREGPRAKSKKGKEYTAYTNRKNFGSDTVMIFWTRENNHLDEIDQLEAPDSQSVARLIDSVTSGSEKETRHIETDAFYSCILSGAAARIAVRDWIQTSLYDFRRAIARWFQDIAIEDYNRDLKRSQTYYCRLYDLANSCQNRAENNDVALSRTAFHLWGAALKNTAPPMWILTAVLKRARIEEYGVTRERAALIKLILNRHNKGGGFMVSEKLARDNKPMAYICGQVFAVLESIQRAALGKTNAGIRERYFTFAMTTPSPAFGRLFGLSSKHFMKLKGEKPGLAVVLDKELQALCKDIKIEQFPSIFSLEQQGQFAIGYYHQRQAQFNRAELKETVEEEAR